MSSRRTAYAILAGYLAALALAVEQARALCTQCWDRVAACESSGRWSLATGNGYYGGLQFDPPTWRAYGGARYAPLAHQASRYQQMLVASRAPLSSWPVCGSRYWG